MVVQCPRKARNASRPPGPRPAWISTRSAATTPGTGTSRWPCWRTPTCPSLRRPSRKPGSGLIPVTLGEVRRLLALNRPAFRPQRSPGLVHLAPAPPAPRQTRPLPAKTSPLQRSAAGVSRPKTLKSLGRPSGRRFAAAHRHAEPGWPASGSGNGAGADLRDVPDRRHDQPSRTPHNADPRRDLRIAGRGSRAHRVVQRPATGPAAPGSLCRPGRRELSSLQSGGQPEG